MKRILSATLGAALLLTAASGAAMARPYGGGYGHGGYSRGYGHGWHGNGGGAMIAAGIGILGLAAILSSQHHNDDYYGPPPPPPPRYGNDRYDGYDGYDGR